jgi:hypothetical protein
MLLMLKTCVGVCLIGKNKKTLNYSMILTQKFRIWSLKEEKSLNNLEEYYQLVKYLASKDKF